MIHPLGRVLLASVLGLAPPLWAAEEQHEATELVAARLAESRQLLATLDRLILDLEAFAARQLEMADQSEDFDQAARYEALHGETLLRVEQLKAQRGQLQAVIDTLETRAGGLDRERP